MNANPENTVYVQFSGELVKGDRKKLSEDSSLLKNVFKRMDEFPCTPIHHVLFVNNISCEDVKSLNFAVKSPQCVFETSSEKIDKMKQTAKVLGIELEEKRCVEHGYTQLKVAQRKHDENVDGGNAQRVMKQKFVVVADGDSPDICFHCDDGIVIANRLTLRPYSKLLRKLFSDYPNIHSDISNVQNLDLNSCKGICLPTVRCDEVNTLFRCILSKQVVREDEISLKSIRRVATMLGLRLKEYKQQFEVGIPDHVPSVELVCEKDNFESSISDFSN